MTSRRRYPGPNPAQGKTLPRKHLTSSALARAAGVETSTIRFYDRRRLIAAEITKPSGYRLYGPETIARVQFIRLAQGLGLSLDEIADLIDLHQTQVAENGSESRQHAQRKLANIDARIKHLQEIKNVLRSMLDGKRSTRDSSLLDLLGLRSA